MLGTPFIRILAVRVQGDGIEVAFTQASWKARTLIGKCSCVVGNMQGDLYVVELAQVSGKLLLYGNCIFPTGALHWQIDAGGGFVRGLQTTWRNGLSSCK